MKRFVLTVAAAFVAAVAGAQGSTGATAPAGPIKIGTINVERLVQESALGKEAFNRVKKLNDQKKDEGDKLQKELRDMEQKLADQGVGPGRGQARRAPEVVPGEGDRLQALPGRRQS